MLELMPIIVVAIEFAIRLTVIGLILVRGGGRPSTRLTWIIVILALPLIGLVAYLMVGEVRLGRRRIDRHQAIVRKIETSPDRAPDRPPQQYFELPPAYEHLAILAEAVGNAQARAGNRLELIGDTDQLIDRLVADIDAAQHHCHLLYYIFLADDSGRRVSEALIRAAQRGVACRLLVDAAGSSDFARSTLRQQLERSGVRVVTALPVNALRALLARLDVRNHRKLAIIDGAVGYVGSHNIADAAFAIKARFAPWVDATVRTVGPITRDLQVLFVEDWYLDTDESLEHVLAIHPYPDPDGVTAQIMGTGPSAYNEALRQMWLAATLTAVEELIITTPYFVPDEATSTAIRTVARRGVATTLVVPKRNDSPLVGAASRSEYDAMLDAGVTVWEYHKGLLHAKTISIDRSLAIIGSANFDRRSFEINFEASLVVYDSDFASQLRFLQRSYMSDATELAVMQWRARGWWRRLIENAAGTLGPLL
jgi:cardiolipin synthase